MKRFAEVITVMGLLCALFIGFIGGEVYEAGKEAGDRGKCHTLRGEINRLSLSAGMMLPVKKGKKYASR